MSFGRVAIIGCHGRMGAMFVQRLGEIGVETAGVDLPFTAENLRYACTGARLAILCIPSRHIKEVTAKLVPYLPSETILADIASVKERPLQAMLEEWNGPVVGTHPLFGPKYMGKEMPVALVPGREAYAMDKVEELFTALGWTTFRTTAREHDEAMAKIQELNFITSSAYFGMLAGDESLLRFITPSFKRRFMASRQMLMDDAPMFTGLFMENPHHHEVLQEYRRLLDVSTTEDVARLAAKASWWNDRILEG